MFCLLSAYRMPKKVEKKGRGTFRFSIIRRKIQTVFQSRALKTALLSELYGGKDAALVARMVDSVSPLVDPPVQVVAPLPPVVESDSDDSDEEEWETVAAVPDNRPPQVAPVQVAPVQVAPVQVAPVQVAPVQVAPVQVAPVQVAPPTPPTTPAPGPSSEDGHTAATAVIIIDSDSSDSETDSDSN